jgi:hypothetical protein
VSTALVDPPVVFDVPGGVLRFGAGALDQWAEHLEWCYRLLGVDDGATIAVQDFGTSPLSYLGSALLMPTLERGVAERMDARLISLDASAERVVITPDAIRQVEPDVLVVRGDVFGLLLDGAKRMGVNIDRRVEHIIVAVGEDTMPLPAGEWERILHVERTLLLAPECPDCGCFHMREGVYRVDGDEIHNLRLAGAKPCSPRGMRVVEETCARAPGDTLVRIGAQAGGKSR